MPSYVVTFHYHGSATYDVEAPDRDAAVVEARQVKDRETAELFFSDRLILDEEDHVVESDEEEDADADTPGGLPDQS